MRHDRAAIERSLQWPDGDCDRTLDIDATSDAIVHHVLSKTFGVSRTQKLMRRRCTSAATGLSCFASSLAAQAADARVGRVPLTPFIEDACRLGDALYLAFADVATSSQVSVARLDGTVTGKLARVPVQGSPLFRETQLEAAVGCQATPSRIVTATRHTGVVTAWSLDGRSLWQTPLPAFRSVTVEPGEGGACPRCRRRSRGGAHRNARAAGPDSAAMTRPS